MHPGDGVSNAPRQRREKRGPNINTNFNKTLLFLMILVTVGRFCHLADKVVSSMRLPVRRQL